MPCKSIAISEQMMACMRVGLAIAHSWKGSLAVAAPVAVKSPLKSLLASSAIVFCRMERAARFTPIVSCVTSKDTQKR